MTSQLGPASASTSTNPRPAAPAKAAAATAGAAVASVPAATLERRAAGRLLIAVEHLPATPPSSAPAGDAALLATLGAWLRDRRGLWIGCPLDPPGPAPRPGVVPGAAAAGLAGGLAGAIQEGGAALRRVGLSAPERESCVEGFVQRALWPLFHDLAPLARFEPADWQAFRAVNRKFARAVAQVVARGGGNDLVWAHDPLLMGLAAELRRLRAPVKAGYFMRLPFPAPDLFLRLPWRERLLAGLLAFDRIGFQTCRDLANFLDCVRLLFREVAAERPDDLGASLAGRAGGRTCALAAAVCPEGIDAAGIAAAAASPEVERRLAALRAAAGGRGAELAGERGDRGNHGYQTVLAHATLTPEQGVPEALRAFVTAMQLRPALRESVSLLLVVEPGRAGGTATASARRREIERLVGEVNGRLGRAGWVPVQYRFQSLDLAERLGLYRAADVALAAPLRAGMAVEAKEYCAADVAERGALVLSEFAGAAARLGGGALLVNPHDAGATARTLLSALRLGGEERRRRMRLLREEVRARDLGWWVREQLTEMRAAPARMEG